MEHREYYLFTDIQWIEWKQTWKKLGSFGMARRKIQDVKGNALREEAAYYIAA